MAQNIRFISIDLFLLFVCLPFFLVIIGILWNLDSKASIRLFFAEFYGYFVLTILKHFFLYAFNGIILMLSRRLFLNKLRSKFTFIFMGMLTGLFSFSLLTQISGVWSEFYDNVFNEVSNLLPFMVIGGGFFYIGSNRR